MTLLNLRLLSAGAMLLLANSTALAQATANAASQPSLTAKEMQSYTPPAYELPWAPLLESAIQKKTRVWHTIDSRDAVNSVFAIDANAQASSLVNVLMEGVFQGKIKAYDASVNDRFTKVLSMADLIALFTPGNGGKGYNPANVVKYRVKEDWLQLKDKGTLLVRIVGLAPVIEVKSADGNVIEQPLFWLFYPDCRQYLAQHSVPAGSSARITSWDQLFEARNFQSKIIKSASPIWQSPVAVKQ